MKAVDDLTLEVELEQAVPYFLNLVAFPSYYPLNEKFVKEKGEKFGLEADTTVYTDRSFLKIGSMNKDGIKEK